MADETFKKSPRNPLKLKKVLNANFYSPQPLSRYRDYATFPKIKANKDYRTIPPEGCAAFRVMNPKALTAQNSANSLDTLEGHMGAGGNNAKVIDIGANTRRLLGNRNPRGMVLD